MPPIYPDRWPIEAGPILDVLWTLGGLSADETENHMVLVNRAGAFEKAIAPTLDTFLEEHGEGRARGRTTLSQLMPGKKHQARGTKPYDDGNCDHRYHLPLLTSEAAFYLADGSYYWMPAGFVYRVDPRRPHAVVNGGDHPLIHLFFNALEQAYGQEAAA